MNPNHLTAALSTGRFARVTFLKVDTGEERTMICRVERPKSTSTRKRDPMVIVVREMVRDAKGRFCGSQYRSFRADTLVSMTVDGTHYDFQNVGMLQAAA